MGTQNPNPSTDVILSEICRIAANESKDLLFLSSAGLPPSFTGAQHTERRANIFLIQSRAMSHMGYSAAKQTAAVFGFEEFWPKVYAQFEKQFQAIADLIALGNEMLEAAHAGDTDPVKNLVCDLTRATMAGSLEAIVLCGNGFGRGAVKIVRGMYESRWTAEYLRRNPEEIQDYLEFSKVLLWRKLQWQERNYTNKASTVPQNVKETIENQYNQVRSQFTDNKGRVRNQWSKKSIGAMATEIGHKLEYELPYSIACSIHHTNFEGLASQFESTDGAITLDDPPSMSWVEKALVATEINLFYALDTLNECGGFGFKEKLQTIQQAFEDATRVASSGSVAKSNQ